MASPLLTDKAMGLGNLGSAESHDTGSTTWAPPTAPASDGPVTRWDGGIMTVSGTANATVMLLILVIASATVTWFSISEPEPGVLSFPVGWVFGGLIVGLVSVMVGTFKPRLARFAGPVYALAEGVVIGAVSRAFDAQYKGIVLQAVGATLAVFVVMLMLYRSRVIKVTDRTRRIVVGMMLGLMAFYLVSFVIGLFGSMPSFINDASPMGIAFSVFVAGLAAFNLALDFDMIEKGAQNKLPAYMEWYGALAVTVTLVWLYLELLRLLAKLRDN